MFTLCEDGAAEDEGEGDDAVASFREWELPSAAFHQARTFSLCRKLPHPVVTWLDAASRRTETVAWQAVRASHWLVHVLRHSNASHERAKSCFLPGTEFNPAYSSSIPPMLPMPPHIIASQLGMLLSPHQFLQLWEQLMYDTAIKDRLLGYATSALLFADRGVAPSVVGINRVMLLHGPPGTGKTSLCKALAQKLAIRFSHRCRAR